MWIDATPEACTFVKEGGGVLFLPAPGFAGLAGGLTILEAATDPAADALDCRRLQVRGFLLFVPGQMRLPHELHVQLRGRFRRRIDALWNGCIYAVCACGLFIARRGCGIQLP